LQRTSNLPAALACLGLFALAPVAHAVSFDNGTVSGNFDSSISTGFGLRTKNASPDLVLQGNNGGPAGQASAFSGVGDQGDLNYKKGDFFTQYIKGNHELLLKLPGQFSFMARANWVRDVAATRTTGYESVAASSPGFPFNGDSYRGGLTGDARKDLRFKARLLDFWASKTLDIGEQQARVRVGQQVINWGESLFGSGGINATNPVDVLRLSQPGTQIKEGILPTPAISVAGGLGHGLNYEAYVQTAWRKNYFAPTGSYWSTTNGLGRGQEAYGNVETGARNTGQWGLALKYRPKGTSLDLGAYAMNYHDKAPQLQLTTAEVAPGVVAPIESRFRYLEDRKLLGLSASFPVGDWAVGTELSYRPREAVFLNPATSFCASQGGRCWVEEKKVQWHLTGTLSMTPSNAAGLLNALGADGATLLAEAVVIHFPGLKQSYGGDLIAAAGLGWGNETDATAAPVAKGTKTSSGLAADFSWTYDGTVIPGWQLVPEVFVSWSVAGRTPTLSGNYLKGAKSANFILSLSRNPASWQFGLNYAKYWRGKTVLDQTLADRDFFGAYATYNF
jgi:hypothetical protein